MFHHLFYILLICTSSLAIPSDIIVAVVDGGVVLESDSSLLEGTMGGHTYFRHIAKLSAIFIHKMPVERLILRKTVLQKAIESGINITDNEVLLIMRQMADHNKLSLPKFIHFVEKGKYNFYDFFEWIREEMIIKRYLAIKDDPPIIISGLEINYSLATQSTRNCLRRLHHLLHISMNMSEFIPPKIIEVLQKKTDKINGLLHADVSFIEISAAYSDSSNAFDGGDIGWRKHGNSPSIFAKIVPKLIIGQISDTVREGNSLNLVKLKEHKMEKWHTKNILASHVVMGANKLITDKNIAVRLQELRKRVMDGGDFVILAQRNSNDMDLSMKNSHLGWTTDVTIVSVLGEEVDILDEGGVGEIFESPLGGYIVKLFKTMERNIGEGYRRHEALDNIRGSKEMASEKIQSLLTRDEAHVANTAPE